VPLWNRSVSVRGTFDLRALFSVPEIILLCQLLSPWRSHVVAMHRCDLVSGLLASAIHVHAPNFSVLTAHSFIDILIF
jgi:hypothetical protein